MTGWGTARRTGGLVAGLLLMSAAAAHGDDRQLRPFIGATFGGVTTFVPNTGVGKPNLTIGVSAVFLGEIFGAEIDVADAPGFFESDGLHLVIGSRVTTVSGNVVVAAPHRMTEYSLRPYAVAGGGLMRVRTTTSLSVFDVSRVLPAYDVGAGIVGFFTDRFGVSWEVRRFHSLGGNADESGLTIGDEHLSFWRATMAVAIRY